MSAARYSGPERREDGMHELREHFDAALADHRRHFDGRIDDLSAKVDPMHDYFVTARTGAMIIKWTLAVLASAAGAWAFMKGWLVGLIR